MVAVFCLNSAFSQTVITITKTTDVDPFVNPYHFIDSLCDPDMYGTLQWAIRKVNDLGGNCIIVFNIPGSGTHEIILQNELPMIFHDNGQITIDGTSQPGYSFGNPQIRINGQNNIGSCFQSYKSDIVIKGFHITDFLFHGIVANTPLSNIEISENIIDNINNGENTTSAIGIRVINSHLNVQEKISGNFIGTIGTIKNIEDYGIFIQSCSNILIGGSDINQANTITNCGWRGIYLASSTSIQMSANKIFDNPTAIYLANSNQNIQPPIITNYSNGILSGTSQPNDVIEIFGSTGLENANEYLLSVSTDINGDWNANISTIYDFLICSTTDEYNNTSSFSDTINVLSSEIPDINHSETILINSFFYNNTVIFPFNGDVIYGISVNGNITFHSDSSLVRIIFVDSINSLEYLIYETYPMIDTVWIFDFHSECEETCFLDGFVPTSIIINVTDATLNIENLKWRSNIIENPKALQVKIKEEKNRKKINNINAYLNAKKMLCV